MGNIDIFERMAKQYDTPERAKIANIIAKEISTHIIDGKMKHAMDYGCGTGLVGLMLHDKFETMLLVDAASNMVDQVNEKIKQLHINNASAVVYDFEQNIPANLNVDYIIVVQTLLHIKDVQPVLNNFYRLLNSDGHLMIVDFDKNEEIISNDVHNGFKQDELMDTLQTIGFTKVETKTFYTGSNIFMNKDASLFIMDARK